MPEKFREVIPRNFHECKETILYDLHFTHPTLFTFSPQPAVWGRSYFISDEEFRIEMQGVDLVIEGVLVPLREDSTEVTGQVNSGRQCIKYNFLVPFGWIAMLAAVLYISEVSLVIVIVLAPVLLATPFAFCRVMTDWQTRWVVRGFIESLEAES